VTELDTVLVRLEAAVSLLVGLDFDGVLAPIVARPEDATPIDGVGEVLDSLAALPAVRVAAVSGRRRADLAERLDPPPGVLLIGEHGADTGDGALREPAGYDEVRSALEAVASRFDGAWVEKKRTGLTIHGRALSTDDAERLASEAEGILQDLVPGLFEKGNGIVDVRLTGMTKGVAIQALRAPGETVLFVGDDTTDETVFAALGPEDVGIKVGPGATLAGYRLPDPEAVVGFLRDLVGIRSR
jgi:trehalose 6-phosphate synthase/phosphatase